MTSPTATVKQLIEGYQDTALIFTAVKLGLIDRLAGGLQTPRDLAEALSVHELALARLLRGLAVAGIVEEHAEPGRFVLTGTGLLLRSDAGNGLAKYALLSAQQYLPAWNQMPAAIEDGRSPFEAAFGSPVWKYRESHPEQGALFNGWLHEQSSTIVEEIVAALDLSTCQTVADVGGGKGVLLSRVLERFPHCRGILAEQPSVLVQAESFLHECGVRDRCDLRPANILESVPAGCDGYLLKSVLHDWEDETSGRILTSIRKAMSPTTAAARLWIIERLLPARAADDPETVRLDLMMMNVTGGRERTLREYRELAAQAGLSLVRALPAGPKFHLLEAVRA